ncbi:type II toxin-antitoxin system RelE/ParE family toxin [Photorhabdus temperata]|uniref:Type II toxin-antitoxin system RelE/ParE family toxin n=1 Tax=Photorhabdus temperata J3 TaxID=1389415 RepID=U7R3X6_PHOTE|nr:hypothetical protein O185_06055 [Photorhabdus temperata J3]
MIKVNRTPEVKRWLKSLKDKTAKAKIIIRIDRMKEGNFGDSEPVGNGISELRIHQGKGYRVYFTNRNNEIAKKWGF